MRLLLIRHGESEHSQRGMIAGYASCPGLTAHGFQQARLLADRLRATGEAGDCAALLSSTVLRARQTAEVLGRELELGPIEQDCDLCELHPGAADGLTWAAYREIYGTFDLIAEPDRPFAPDAESWQEFVGRVQMTLERLATRFEGQTVIAVTHAGFIVASFLLLFAIPRPGTGARVDPAYTAITEWEYSQATWRLVRFNDSVHELDIDITGQSLKTQHPE